MKNSRIWWFVLLTPLLILGLAVARRHRNEVYLANGNALAAQWLAQTFAPIGDGPQFRETLDKIRVQDAATLNGAEKDSLDSAVAAFFLAYHDGDLDSYRRFRMPTGRGTYNPAILKWVLHDIQSAGAVPATTNLENGDLIMSDYWVKVGARLFTNFFEGFCLEQSELDIARTANLRPSLTQEFGFTDFKPVYLPEPQPDEIKRQFGEITYATLISLVTNSDGVAYPVACRWYYSPNDKIWIVDALGENHSRGNIKRKTFLRF